MNIIIPMAGMGKRMRPHTLTTPKPLIPIAGKPIVQRLVEDITHTVPADIDSIAFIIHPAFGQEIEELLLSIAKDFGAEGHICYQDDAQGTGHAIMCAKDLLKGEVFIAFADTLFDAQFKIDMTKEAVIWTQRVADPSQFGVVKLDDQGKITEFIEKPEAFVSDLAIIGVYFFKDGDNLRKHLQYLIDHDIKVKGEYQLTDAMERMRQEGLAFYTDVVDEWLDCGNKDATVYTNQRILELKQDKEQFMHPTAELHNVTVIQPVYIGENVVITDSVIGPHVSIEPGAKLQNTVISNTIVMKNSVISDKVIRNSMIGNHTLVIGQAHEMNIGDYTIV